MMMFPPNARHSLMQSNWSSFLGIRQRFSSRGFLGGFTSQNHEMMMSSAHKCFGVMSARDFVAGNSHLLSVLSNQRALFRPTGAIAMAASTLPSTSYARQMSFCAAERETTTKTGSGSGAAAAAVVAGVVIACAAHTAQCDAAASHKSVPLPGIPGTTFERTLVFVKPEGVHRGLVSNIMGRWERRGFTLVACKLVKPSYELVRQHYNYMSERPFYDGLCEHMSESGPVLAMVWQGRDVIKTSRLMIGATNPLTAAPGTVRGDLAVHVGRNVVHASDGVIGAATEIQLWFRDEEIAQMDSAKNPWLYDEREIENNAKRAGHTY
ncbi:nucleoside diphosphate kinase [Pycnococcus provasolii]|uniref:Nucleoside diphosphate kinase n=1 Tax=Pycnococcus provasolii TaxID=41880 RepID=A0A830HAE0_9CHLO|nr:nucleoside diphosphate kinase [Pycnococcus provasolii]|mmetsp:Transcript_11953/g.26819  ORF Transcript_11953/g.26819 Transcript_11953/m.26819 type:complete len:323 (-) Transcript_11953:60-1028(-)